MHLLACWPGPIRLAVGFRVSGFRAQGLRLRMFRLSRGSTYTTIRELGPIIPYIVWYFGAEFPNSCIYGPSGL